MERVRVRKRDEMGVFYDLCDMCVGLVFEIYFCVFKFGESDEFMCKYFENVV